MKKEYPKEYIRPTSHEQVVFKDGMIVTADDLQAALNYSLGVFQTLIRAFFGCGIVCGLKVEVIEGATQCGNDQSKKNTWCVKVFPGVALDCQGYPLELCKEITIDLTPDPCSLQKIPKCVCIAIRRYIEEEPQPKSNCNGSDVQSSQNCSRKREQLMIKVFDSDQLPKNICKQPCNQDDKQQAQMGERILETPALRVEQGCECLKACPDCNCCGDGWVLLACMQFDECGIECIDHSHRKYVKPINCLCPPEVNDCNTTIGKKTPALEPATEKPTIGSRSKPGK